MVLPDDVQKYLDSISNSQSRHNADVVLEIMLDVTRLTPHMWGSIVAFGSYHYTYATGREGDAPIAAFAARKAALTIYLADRIEAHEEELARLGEHSTGVGCLYIKDISVVDTAVLEKIIRSSFDTVSDPAFGSQAAQSTRRGDA
jgi:hypothetical protein